VRELGISSPRVDAIVREPGFPLPVARFGEARIWLYEQVEAYLAGRPFAHGPENALQDKLMDSAALADYLGYKRRSVPELVRNVLLTPPVAKAGGSNVWLKAQIDARLEADPDLRANLKQRLARRHSERRSQS
jgi:predicted DNA-binding transcriptional regulator AlpA